MKKNVANALPLGLSLAATLAAQTAQCFPAVVTGKKSSVDLIATELLESPDGALETMAASHYTTQKVVVDTRGNTRVEVDYTYDY